MKKALKILAILLALVVLALSWPTYKIYQGIAKSRSEDPLVWEFDIAALEAKTAGVYQSGEPVIFIGSSSIRFWDTLAQDMAPIPVLQHGFGGAKLFDVVYYADRLVTAYQPRAVVVFAGTNDITPAASKPPAVLLASYQDFIASIRQENAELPVFYIGITPSPSRWSVWPIAQEANRLISAWVDSDPNLYFIDTSASLIGSDGQPDKDNYDGDGLHLSARGYQVWTGIIRKRLRQELQGF
jgi:hypothetical protein